MYFFSRVRAVTVAMEGLQIRHPRTLAETNIPHRVVVRLFAHGTLEDVLFISLICLFVRLSVVSRPVENISLILTVKYCLIKANGL